MTDMAFHLDPSAIAEAIRRGMEGFTPTLAAQQVGRITEVGDGIARVAGLPSAAVNELLEFEGGTLGLAFGALTERHEALATTPVTMNPAGVA